MTVLEHAIEVLRLRFPMDAERKRRLARGLRVNVRYLPEHAIESYYGQLVNQIAGSFLDRLNDDELEIRLDIDQRRLLECEERDLGPLEESLGWTLKEMVRRGGLTPREAPSKRPEVWAANPVGGMRW